ESLYFILPKGRSEKVETIEKESKEKTEIVDAKASSEIEAQVQENTSATPVSFDQYDTPGALIGAAKRRAEKEAEAKEKAKADVAPKIEEKQEAKGEMNNVRTGHKAGMVVATMQYPVLKLILDLVESQASSSPYVTLHFDRQGLHTQILDPSRVSLNTVDVDREAFIELVVSEEGYDLNIDAEKILELKIPKSANVSLRVQEDKPDTYLLRYNNLEIRLNQVEVSREEGHIPPLSYNGDYARVQVKDLVGFLDGAAHITDSFRITMTSRGIELRAQSDDREMKRTLECEYINELVLRGAEKYVAQYPNEYLKKELKALKAMSGISEVKLEMKDDYPLRMTVGYYDIHITYLLAPRIEG
ncbi:MAG: hypothetical protein QXW75_00515, partial [Thermoplasmatales archaeon]